MMIHDGAVSVNISIEDGEREGTGTIGFDQDFTKSMLIVAQEFSDAF